MRTVDVTLMVDDRLAGRLDRLNVINSDDGRSRDGNNIRDRDLIVIIEVFTRRVRSKGGKVKDVRRTRNGESYLSND